MSTAKKGNQDPCPTRSPSQPERKEVKEVNEKRSAASVETARLVLRTTLVHCNCNEIPAHSDATRKLSDEEMALLYEDICKPLDIYSILRQRRAQIVNNCGELVFQ